MRTFPVTFEHVEQILRLPAALRETAVCSRRVWPQPCTMITSILTTGSVTQLLYATISRAQQIHLWQVCTINSNDVTTAVEENHDDDADSAAQNLLAVWI